MKKITIKVLTVFLFLSLINCGNKNSNSIDSSIEDDGSGEIYKRMGIEEPRSLNYQPSEFHKTHINRILFTNNINLNPEEATAKDFKTNFIASEVIKGVAYLDQTAGEKFGQDGFPILQYKVGNKSHKWQVESYRKYDQALTFLEFFISVHVEDYIPTKGGSSTIANSMETLSNLSNENYQLDTKLYTSSGSKTNLAERINYDATNKKDKFTLANEIKQIRIKHVSSIPQPKANMSAPEIEEQLVEHFNTMGWDETFNKTIILSDEFRYKKSYAGIIVAKTLSVAMVSKMPEGFCMYQVFTVIADKTDSGYSKFKRYSTGDQQGCSCD